jgi:hypothetical protein
MHTQIDDLGFIGAECCMGESLKLMNDKGGFPCVLFEILGVIDPLGYDSM